ncbi:MAG: hypothetical protein HYX78_08225 [Armatimonadetes bacterium]|nr:hypothetical protein [Armatimonadota bacterium]
MRRWRVIIGTALSIAAVGAFAVALWFVSNALDRAFRLPDEIMLEPVALILTGMTWSLGLFWVFWAYSYLIFVGGGSPVEAFGVALEPTSRLVTAGPYAYVRNPLVFGLLFLLLGVAFLANSISGIVLVPIVGVLAAVYLRVFEEKGLVRRFGIAYEHYREHVPLLIPRIRPYAPPEGER